MSSSDESDEEYKCRTDNDVQDDGDHFSIQMTTVCNDTIDDINEDDPEMGESP